MTTTAATVQSVFDGTVAGRCQCGTAAVRAGVTNTWGAHTVTCDECGNDVTCRAVEHPED